MLGKLLKNNISIRQTTIYIVANFLGLLIIGAALQLFRDLSNPSATSSDPLHASRLFILTHKLQASSFLNPSPHSFSPSEIEELSRQPWTQDVDKFTPSTFDATIGLRLGADGFSTAIFFEGIPERFIDIPEGYPEFDPSSPEVSIILPHDYLTLYNFGFAPARGLPSLDEHTLRLLPLTVTLAGNGHTLSLPGRIIGFSSRITTIGAPAPFVEWANQKFGTSELSSPNRLIVVTDEFRIPEAEKYFADNGINASGGDENSGRLSRFLKIAASIIISIGAIISALAIGILLLSIFLLIQKNRRTLSDLMHLGYTPGMLARFYIKFIASVNLVVLLFVAGTLAVGANLWQPSLSALGFAPTSVWPSILMITGIMGAVTAMSIAIIYHLLRRIPS